MSEPVEVVIQFKSKIKREKEPVQSTTYTMNGQIQEKGNSFYLSYKEHSPEMGVSTHVIKVDRDHALIMRKGPISMRLPLIKGEETLGNYQSPAGPFSMRAKTEQCRIHWENGAGEIGIAYQLILQNEYVGKFTLEFKLKAR